MMSFLPGPKIGGINILTGGGNKYTDPAGLFKEPPPPPPPPEQTWGKPWMASAANKDGAARAAAAAAGTGNPGARSAPKDSTSQVLGGAYTAPDEDHAA